LAGDPPLRWLRLRIVHGQFAESPKLSFVKINVARAIAARTIRDEVLEPVPNSRGRQWRLSQTPILPDSLILEVDEGDIATQWGEVSALAALGAEDKVYALDPGSGELTFGDGVHGAAVPSGFRNVRAVRYRVGGGKAGAVDADAVSTLLSSTPF